MVLKVLRLGLGRQVAFIAIKDPSLRGVVTMLKVTEPLILICMY